MSIPVQEALVPELYDDDDDKDEDVALHKGVESILIVSATSPTAMRWLVPYIPTLLLKLLCTVDEVRQQVSLNEGVVYSR